MSYKNILVLFVFCKYSGLCNENLVERTVVDDFPDDDDSIDFKPLSNHSDISRTPSQYRESAEKRNWKTCSKGANVPRTLELGKGKIEYDSSDSIADDAAVDDNYQRCSEYNVTFLYDTKYTQHFERVHGNRAPYECPHCRLNLRTIYTLKRHIIRKHPRDKKLHIRRRKNIPNNITCDTCKISFETWRSFETHALSKHAGVRMMVCLYCDKKYMKRVHLLRHTQEKHSTEELKCGLCNNIFENSAFLEEHSEHCEKRQNEKRKGESTTQLENCAERVKEHRCDECGERFKFVLSLEKHFRVQHPNLKLFSCDHCDKAFHVKKSLERHMDKWHADRESPFLPSAKRERSTRYTCKYCGRDFPSLGKFESHGIEIHQCQPMFHCKVCNMGFSYRRTLKPHMIEQHGIAKTPCDYCSRYYSNDGNVLNEHVKRCRRRAERRARWRERGWPIFRCDICNRELCMKKTSFRSHQRRHKEYDSCAKCNEGFHRLNNPGGLSEHMRVRHPIIDKGNVKGARVAWKEEIVSDEDDDIQTFVLGNANERLLPGRELKEEVKGEK